MKQGKLIRRAVSAVLAGCMMFTLSAPALAESTDALMQLSISGLAAQNDAVEKELATVTITGVYDPDIIPPYTIYATPDGAQFSDGLMNPMGNCTLGYDGTTLTIDCKTTVPQEYNIKIALKEGVSLRITAEQGGTYQLGHNVTITGTADVTIEQNDNTLVAGDLTVDCTGALKITGSSTYGVCGALNVQNSSSVEVTGSCNNWLIGSGNITSDGTVTLQNSAYAGAAVAGDLTVKAGGKVAARAVQTAVVGNADITTDDDVALSAYDHTSSNRKDTASVAVVGKLTVHNSANVFVTIWSTGSSAIGQGADITSNGVVFVRCNDGQNSQPIINGDTTITAGGEVQMNNSYGTGPAVNGTLNIEKSKGVSLDFRKADMAVNGNANITSSDMVTLSAGQKAVSGTLNYKPDFSGTEYNGYEVYANGTDITDLKAQQGGKLPDYTYTGSGSHLQITPVTRDAPIVDEGDAGSASGSDASADVGGALAAVALGSAAVWGGYEVATRVILNKLLPEGAAIPANRGQLALLVWNNAGRPEPAAQPAFADVADADMAKAAQWCAEQGIMEAKTADTFKPEGWTPKFKVIETWNKAFPKQ